MKRSFSNHEVFFVASKAISAIWFRSKKKTYMQRPFKINQQVHHSSSDSCLSMRHRIFTKLMQSAKQAQESLEAHSKVSVLVECPCLKTSREKRWMILRCGCTQTNLTSCKKSSHRYLFSLSIFICRFNLMILSFLLRFFLLFFH